MCVCGIIIKAVVYGGALSAASTEYIVNGASEECLLIGNSRTSRNSSHFWRTATRLVPLSVVWIMLCNKYFKYIDNQQCDHNGKIKAAACRQNLPYRSEYGFGNTA